MSEFPENPYQKVKDQIIQIINSVDLFRGEKLNESIEIPPQQIFGDFSTKVCFSLSRKIKRSPHEIAEEVTSKIKIPFDSLIDRVESKSGYVNFYINYDKMARLVLETILIFRNKYGSLGIGKNKKVVVEFPSVNPGKPWHVGHARTAIIGDTIHRLLRFANFNVESQDYIDDLGLQAAQVLWGILNLGGNELPERKDLLNKEDHWQGSIYVKVANLFASNINIEEKVRALMKDMEAGKPDVQKLLSEKVELCLKSQYQTAFRLGIYHDVKIHESDIISSGLYEEAKELMKKSDKIVLETSGLNAGCLVAKLEEYPQFKGMKSVDKILVRSDGTATYTCKDLAYQLWKFGVLKSPVKFKTWQIQPNNKEMWSTSVYGKRLKRFGHADRVINIIGSEQKYPQNVLRYLLKILGFNNEFENSIHLSHEHVWIFGKKLESLSGRTGSWKGFTVDEVLNEAYKRAYEEVNKRNPNLSNTEKSSIAETVGKAAFRFLTLSTNLDKIAIFNYDIALSFKGETGSYLLYAFARICGILRKIKDWKPEFKNNNITDIEKKMIILLAKFPDVVKESVTNLKPLLICRYTYELASNLDRFYETCPVIKAETEGLKNYRATLIQSTKIVLKNSFNLIGIDALERM